MSVESWDAPEPGWSAVVLSKRYRLSAFITGSESVTVYRAHDAQLDRSVVVNVLRSQHAGNAAQVRHFREAAGAVAGLNHPNLVTVFNVGFDTVNGAEWHYAVTELVEGRTLQQHLREVGRCTAEEAVHIALSLCSGISYVHKRGLVHGAIRPRSVLLGRDGRVKAADFGFVPADGVEGDPYRAPDAASTSASDVYALGALLYEMLTGEPPVAEPRPRPSAVNPTASAQLDDIVWRALAAAPIERYRNADHLAAALFEYMRQGERQTLIIEKPVAAPVAPSAPSVAERVQARQEGAVRRRGEPMAAPAVGETDVVTLPPADRAEVRVAPSEPLGCGVIALAVLAVLSVLGLIPLYARVYFEYTKPPAPIVTTPDAATPTVSEVVIVATAAPPAALPTPTPAVMVDLPADLIGRPLDDALRAWFAERRVSLFERREYSLSPDGTIIDAAPDAMSVAEGSVLTLTLSTGGAVPLNAQLGGAFVLDSARFTRDDYRPGMSVKFDVTWRASRAVGKDYRVFVHLHDAAGGFVAQTGDRAPFDRGIPFPTAAWTAETVVLDSYELPIPLDAPPGVYEIRVGLYDDAGRLAVTSGDAERVKNSGVVVGVIRVQ
jgi:serine/threonine-protein kinase